MRRRTPPLAGLRVVDLTDLRGALAGRMLADLGAEVVLVEPPGGHAGGAAPPFAGGVEAPDRSLPFLYRSAGKRSVALELARPGGRKRLDALLAEADVLIENLSSAERDRLALAPADVRAR